MRKDLPLRRGPRSYRHLLALTINESGAYEASGRTQLSVMEVTSSAYGANTEMPYAETHRAVHPMSFYAATKIANEAMAHS